MTDFWDVRNGGLPSESLLIPSDVATEMGFFVPQILPDEIAALDGLEQQRKAERDARANYQVINGLLQQLPQVRDFRYRSPNRRIEVSTLEEAKLVQRFAIFNESGTPYYLVGRQAGPEPGQTRLLLGPAFQSGEPEPIPLISHTVYDEDMRAYDEAVIAQHTAEYSKSEIGNLVFTGRRGYLVGASHPRSVFLAPASQVPFGRWLSMRLRQPNPAQGLRGPNASHQGNIIGISNGYMETFEVYDYLNSLAAAFGKRALLAQLTRKRFGEPEQPDARPNSRAPLGEIGRAIGVKLLQGARWLLGPNQPEDK